MCWTNDQAEVVSRDSDVFLFKTIARQLQEDSCLSVVLQCKAANFRLLYAVVDGCLSTFEGVVRGVQLEIVESLLAGLLYTSEVSYSHLFLVVRPTMYFNSCVSFAARVRATPLFCSPCVTNHQLTQS